MCVYKAGYLNAKRGRAIGPECNPVVFEKPITNLFPALNKTGRFITMLRRAID
jgi:hypothetical protein